MLSKNRIKYIRSLKIKKYRDLNNQFVVEGDKIILDCLSHETAPIEQLIATTRWLERNPVFQNNLIKEVVEVTDKEYSQVTSLEHPTGIMAVLDKSQLLPEHWDVTKGISLVLDTIQDPGNLGTIIRTASWFGVHRIFCSPDCADCYNPKVVQASMGAVLHTPVYYTDLQELLKQNEDGTGITIYGAFISGNSIWDEKLNKDAMIVFGNESQGISDKLISAIKVPLNIPGCNTAKSKMESLNVAAAVAVICAAFARL